MTNFQELAYEIGITKSQLNNLVNFSDNYYKSFYLYRRKKKRIIDSPNKEMKAIQKWILRNILDHIQVHTKATGFVKGKGIKRNAAFHLNKQFIMCLDIKDFFPSITLDAIYKSLLLEINDSELAYKISKICTFKKYLPQGAPTSPAISNIVFRPIDEKITHLCNKRMVSYSRYADDLTFSCNNKQVLIDLKNDISSILYDNKFLLNNKKFRIMSGKNCVKVTGLIINSGKPTVGRELKRDIRSDIYRFIVKKDRNVDTNKLIGNIAWVRDIEPDYFQKIVKYKNELLEKQQLDFF